MEVPSNILWKDTMEWHCARYRFEEHTIHFKNKCMVGLAVSFGISLEQAETYRDRGHEIRQIIVNQDSPMGVVIDIIEYLWIHDTASIPFRI